MERRGNNGALLKRFIKEREEAKKKSDIENNKQKGSNKHQSSSSKTDKESSVEEATNDDEDKCILDGWQELPSLNIVNILYDLTPPEYIKKVITEFGALPPSSVPVSYTHLDVYKRQLLMCNLQRNHILQFNDVEISKKKLANAWRRVSERENKTGLANLLLDTLGKQMGYDCREVVKGLDMQTGELDLPLWEQDLSLIHI